ncbi:MAG TPA: DUF3784 domain-containing protein [Syntrophomonadaceae bacterium]|nr:DUF3784 domain-containing protein [Syntrophomonadaceae bacterium]
MATEIIMTLITSGMLILFGALTKYGKAYNLIAGYNTSSPEEKKYMAEKGLGDFIGRQLMITAGAPLVGLLFSLGGFVWGFEVGIALLIIIVIYTVIGAQRYNPPPSFHSSHPEALKKSRRQFKTFIVIMVVSVLFSGGVIGSVVWAAQPPKFIWGETQMTITGAYGVPINYADIERVELNPTLPHIGYKNNGLDSGPILKGHFDISGLGHSLLFLRSAQGPVIVVYRTGHQEPVLINFTDSQQTTALYQQLQSKTTH